MKAYAQLLAALTLTLAPLTLTTVTLAAATPAWAEQDHRGNGRGQGRGGGQDRGGQERGGRGQERGGEGRREYRGGGDGYRGPVYSGGRGYGYPPPAYYPQPVPVYPQPYSYAPPPGYAPNSLGAGWGQQQDEARRGVRQGLMPLGQVMQNISRGTPGRLLDAGLEPGPDGRPAYRVRWAAAGGRRIDFIVDAATGAIIGSSGY
jgi:hypothetical protein